MQNRNEVCTKTLEKWQWIIIASLFQIRLLGRVHGRLICYTCMDGFTLAASKSTNNWSQDSVTHYSAMQVEKSEIMKLTVTVWWVLIVAHRALLHPASLLAASLITFPYKTLPSCKTENVVFERIWKTTKIAKETICLLRVYFRFSFKIRRNAVLAFTTPFFKNLCEFFFRQKLQVYKWTSEGRSGGSRFFLIRRCTFTEYFTAVKK